MAIVTGELYKGFTFGGISSKAYGVYITQEAAYNAPDRDVEVVEIAGRNGAYILDKGRFKNITVSYKCGIALDDEQSFESAIRTFRNALASKAGKYVRLEDDYNVNEYRQAAFLGGIEVDMADRRAGEFTVSFDAMPQRFLKAGETSVSVASGGQITNPTLFESHPLLQVWGYGDIGINNDTITIDDVVIGNVILSNGSTSMPYVDFTETNLRVGDTITLNHSYVYTANLVSDGDITDLAISQILGDHRIIADAAVIQITEREYRLNVSFENIAFTAGTETTKNVRIEVSFNYTRGGETVSPVVAYNIEVIYSTNGRIRISERFGQSVLVPNLEHSVLYTIGAVTAYSTKSALGEPLYFDLDIGEAYKEEDGTIISVNNAVSFPAQLPVLKSGTNTITLDDTVDQFKIVPRWWRV